MIRSSVRSAGLAILLSMNGCGDLVPPVAADTKSPGLNVAEAALEGGSGEVALQVSEGVLKTSPDNEEALAIKGDALTLLGATDQATAIFQAMLAKDPRSVRANTGMGRVKLGKDPAAAEAYFRAVLQRDPKNLTALNNLGIARDLQGRHADAQSIYRQALAFSPDLESTQVNLSLSLAMTGHGPEAIKLLKPRATDPAASAKVRHDYAVVLAMAGHRQEAERILTETLSPQQARQVLDNATASSTRMAREQTPQPPRTARLAEETVPADVLQVPETKLAPETKLSMVRGGGGTVEAARAPAPMVVRPHPSGDADDPSLAQPVNSVAAAMTNQRPLAVPLRAGDGAMPPGAMPPGAMPVREAAAASGTVTPETVAVPASPRLAMADAPPPPPSLTAVALPPGYRPTTPPARAEPGITAAASRSAPVHLALAVTAVPTPSEPRPTDTRAVPAAAAEPPAAPEAAQSGEAAVRHDEATAAVQFAAVPTEAAAHDVWHDLVHRFPGLLGQREPTVMRFEHGGTVFWRLRTEGFGTPTEAQDLCARLRSGGQQCFVPKS